MTYESNVHNKDYKLALDAFKIILQASNEKTKEGFRSRARDLVEEIYTSGFVPTFFYIFSKAGLEDKNKMDSFITFLSSALRDSPNGKLEEKEDASYRAYLFIILFYLSKEEIINNTILDNLNNVDGQLGLINEFYAKAPIISARLRTYLIAIKRLAEALI
ncbi:type III-B CRISPR module-associated protein Cmr5 [Acidianus sp. HS-5]|uniref:type III-B CRISPR module-associated protein Cmr5 n=1 Tax=Acidianus sp. HS-5 TaxID=2886040 RepID=UPI001F01D7EC|nr:type III-B CRISPR module-associated protein Cmr5 [Acidianus sp. HS-5]BDC17372.1 type III-B CRISPR module-associated protein Cmr5 [Acidianus sp. HS-5]